MIKQTVFKLSPKRRGCHLITSEIMSGIPQQLPETGLLNLFVQHTSCALTINENADPDVRGDMARIMDCLVCEGEPYYEHTLEGLDDMPAHAKSSLFGVSITIPISAHRLALGTWQGIYGSSRISGAWIFRKVLNLQHENCRCNMDVPSRWLERTVRDSPVRTN